MILTAIAVGNSQTKQEPRTAPSARSAVSLRARQLVTSVLQSQLPPDKAWDLEFQKASYSSEVLADAVQQLHVKKNYEQAVECLLSSLRNDHGQPWTYDVLAIEMKLANRPVTELNRVLQSRVDFTAGHIPQMMITAAMLSRFDADREALQLCRQATESAPHVPEPWLLARGMADKLDLAEDRVWARCGVLRYVWSDNHAREHDEARKVVGEIIDQQERAGHREAASAMREQLAQANAIDLRIVLRWAGSADLDLIVDEPAGTRCDFKNRLTASGGRLVREDSGSGEQSGNHIEEYVCQTAANGNYNASIRFVLGKVVAGNAVVDIVQNLNTSAEKRTRSVIKLTKDDVQIPIVVEHGRGPVITGSARPAENSSK